MSAELLREAAALMRERAEAATSGPWVSPGSVVRGLDHESVGSVRKRNAAHIASWHPAVALAVADWLDAEATESRWRLRGVMNAAVDVARAYLGHEPVTEEQPQRRSGGMLPGPLVKMTVTYMGDCVKCGRHLYSFNGGSPEHVISPYEARSGKLDWDHVPVLGDDA